MPREPIAAEDTPAPPLSPVSILIRLGAIGLVSLLITAAFIYTGGWLEPSDRLTPVRVVDGFEHLNGIQAGFRRNHAKGVCFTGIFESNGQGSRYSKAALFLVGQVHVVGRFALAGGQPYVPDSAQAVRSMAVRFKLSDGEEWRTGMNDIPVFPFATLEAFYEQMTLSQPDPATGKPDPAKMANFIAHHPETARALDLIKNRPISSGFQNDSFHSLNAFRFVDAGGKSVAVRWSMMPTDPFAAPDAASAEKPDKNYLFDDLAKRVKQEPLQFHLVVTIGQAGDPTNDATLPWPPDRQQVTVGTLMIDHVEGEDAGSCRDVNFDPLQLPAGLEPSDDPLLEARSASYARSFTRRAGEPKSPSAVTEASIDKGS
jgi:catalase